MSFDPYTCEQRDMEDLADHIETYLDFLSSVVLISPQYLSSREKENFKEGEERTKKLIKNLRKGKKDKIFKDFDDWQSL